MKTGTVVVVVVVVDPSNVVTWQGHVVRREPEIPRVCFVSPCGVLGAEVEFLTIFEGNEVGRLIDRNVCTGYRAQSFVLRTGRRAHCITNNT